MISWIILLVYFVTAMQGILTRCEILAILSAVCLAISLALVFRDNMPRWLRWGFTSVVSGFLAGIAVFSGFAYLQFGQSIAEYGFATIESALLMVLTMVLMFPERKMADP